MLMVHKLHTLIQWGFFLHTAKLKVIKNYKLCNIAKCQNPGLYVLLFIIILMADSCMHVYKS